MTMRESQYQIPVTAEVPIETPEAVVENQPSEQHAQPVSIEYAPAPEIHAATKLREQRIDQYRFEATQTPPPRPEGIGAKIMSLLSGDKQLPPTLPELLDKEGRIGGELFRVDSRFWLHPRLDGDAHETRDWYFSFTQNKQEFTIRYQSSPTGFHKLYNGREYPFASGELERLYEASSTYETMVAEKVYGRSVSPRSL